MPLPYMPQCMLAVPFVETPTNDATFWDSTKMMANYSGGHHGTGDNKCQALETYELLE